METQHLNQYELAKRCRMSQRTLERWRLVLLKRINKIVLLGGGIVKIARGAFSSLAGSGCPFALCRASGTKTLITRFVEPWVLAYNPLTHLSKNAPMGRL